MKEMDSRIRPNLLSRRAHTSANDGILDNRRGSYQSASQVHSPTYSFGSNHEGNSYLNQQQGSVNQKRVLGLSSSVKRKRTPPVGSSSKKDFSGRWANDSEDFDVSFESSNAENITPFKPDSTAWTSGVESWISTSTSCSRPSPLSSIDQYGDNQVNRLESSMRSARSLTDRPSPLPTTGSTQVNRLQTRSFTGRHSPSPIPGSVQCPYCGNGIWMTEGEFSDHLRDYHLHKYNTCLLPHNHHLSPAQPAPKPPKPKCPDCLQEKEDYSGVYKCVMGHKEERKREKERLRAEQDQEASEELEKELEKQDQFVCPECSGIFKTRKSLTQHRYRRHEVMVRPPGVEKSKIICEFCSFVFTKRSSLTRHLPLCPKKPKDGTNLPPSIPTTPTPPQNPNLPPQNPNLPPQNPNLPPQNPNLQPQNPNLQPQNPNLQPQNPNLPPQNPNLPPQNPNLPPPNINPPTQDQNHPTKNQNRPSQPTPNQNYQNQNWNYSTQNQTYPTQIPSHPTQIPSHPTQIPSHPTQIPSHPTQIPSHPPQNQTFPSYPTHITSHQTQSQILPTQNHSHTTPNNNHLTQNQNHSTQIPSHLNHNQNYNQQIYPSNQDLNPNYVPSFQNSLVPANSHHSPVQSSHSNLRSQGSFSSVYSIDSSAGII